MKTLMVRICDVLAVNGWDAAKAAPETKLAQLRTLTRRP